MMQTNRKDQIRTSQQQQPDDLHRLALLWRAFEEAESRIRDLERELDHRRSVTGAADKTAVVIDEQAIEREFRARYEKAADELRRDHEIIERQRVAERASHAAEADALRRAAETNARLANDAERALATARAELADLREQLAVAERQTAAALQERILSHELDLSFHVAARSRMASDVEIARNELAGAMMQVEDLLAERASWKRDAEDARLAVAAADARRIAAERARDVARGDADLACERLDAAVSHLANVERDFAEALQLHALVESDLIVELESAAAPPERRMPVQERLYPFVMRRIREMPSVAPHEVSSFRALGINTTDALLYADLAAVNATTEIPMARLAKIRALAELSSIHGVAHHSAERLYAAGARTIRDVARMSADELERVLTPEGGHMERDHLETILHNATFEEVLQAVIGRSA